MTAPAKALPTPQKPTVAGIDREVGNRPPFGGLQAAPPDKRQVALQAAVTTLRGRPVVKTEDVLAMAEEFHKFLLKG